ncbi:MAG: ImmA/IrrE family metallo-endopeptidase [Pedobacter sp.]
MTGINQKTNSTPSQLKTPRKRVLSSLARGVADLYCPELPILPETIATATGLTFNYNNYEDYFDGMLEHLSGEFHIYMNLDKSAQGSARSRFTFAHELGHYFIDEHRLALEAGLTPSHPSYTNFQSENIVEKEADYFASCLLMPEDRIKFDCYNRAFGPELINFITAKYNVSATAFLLRYVQSDQVPIMVICSRNAKISWRWQSDNFLFKYLKSINRSLPNVSVTAEFYKNGTEYSTPQNDLFAEDWFNYTDHEPNTFRLKEYCIYAKKQDMVLTMIWY